MKGRILHYSVQENAGVISSDDGSRYEFTGDQWKEHGAQPVRGMAVDFDVKDQKVINVYRGLEDYRPPGAGEKNKMVAGLLAIFLGWLGAHKFYLGYTGPGVLLLVLVPVNFVLAFVVVGLFTGVAVGVLTLVEGLIYLTQTDELFDKTYVQNTKHWF